MSRLESFYQDEKQHGFEQIIGNSIALEALFEAVQSVEPTPSTVLIQGETGTDKELVTKPIHKISPRFGCPSVKVNCAAIPFDLVESELFGDEKGAFTGAIAQRIGCFELADHGTLFLDKGGDIPTRLPPKLLWVLQEQEFGGLGSSRTQSVDVRVFAATYRNLGRMVERGEFRGDLYYRLSVLPLLLPPLRERHEDIPAHVTHFVDLYGRQIGKRTEQVPEEITLALASYEWPGNVRELQNVIQRAVILSRDGVLPNPLPLNNYEIVPACSNPFALKEVERTVILQALEPLCWKISSRGRCSSQTRAKAYFLAFQNEKTRNLSACSGAYDGASCRAARAYASRRLSGSTLQKLCLSTQGAWLCCENSPAVWSNTRTVPLSSASSSRRPS